MAKSLPIIHLIRLVIPLTLQPWLLVSIIIFFTYIFFHHPKNPNKNDCLVWCMNTLFFLNYDPPHIINSIIISCKIMHEYISQRMFYEAINLKFLSSSEMCLATKEVVGLQFYYYCHFTSCHDHVLELWVSAGLRSGFFKLSYLFTHKRVRDTPCRLIFLVWLCVWHLKPVKGWCELVVST